MSGHLGDLRELWLGGQDNRLCAREQAKAWALREVWLEENKKKEKGTYGLNEYVAARVRKNRGGKPAGEHPSGSSMKEFFEKVDKDEEWFPGKHSGAKRGPDRVLKGPKKNGIIQAAKRLMRDEGEVTYSSCIAAAPNAAVNPATGEPVSPDLIYRVFLEEIYDDPDDPEDKWDHRARLSRVALDPNQIKRRLGWAEYMTNVVTRTASWFFVNLVWCDLCSSILPRTQKKSTEQKQARKGNKGWGSKASQKSSRTLKTAKKVLKMKSTGTIKVWFVPILTRGKFHIEPLPENFPGETAEGAEIMVAKVRAALNVRFRGGTAPKVLFTDRGNGFYDSGSGAITDGYQRALRQHGLRSFMGNNAAVQPGDLQEAMLHETAMAWVRQRLKRTAPKEPWKETVAEYNARLKDVAAYINDKYKVEALCRELPKRVEMLMDSEGDRIAK